MTDYQPVSKALESGADPAMLCATCPWDRTCLTPPTMSRAEIDAAVADATAKDTEESAKLRAAGQQPGMPVGLLITSVLFAGRDTQAQICPVFALRLRSSGGRNIADGLKASMQGWDDQS